MGLDTGFKLRIKNGLKDKEIKTPEQYKQTYVDLLFLGRVSETVDNLIKSISIEKDEICYIGISKETSNAEKTIYDNIVVEKPEFPEAEFDVNYKQLLTLINKIKPLAKILAKYSDRIISNLVNDYDDDEISKEDKSKIKDLLFEIAEEAGYEDIFYLTKIHDFFSAFFMSEINSDSGIQADLIYWRSY